MSGPGQDYNPRFQSQPMGAMGGEGLTQEPYPTDPSGYKPPPSGPGAFNQWPPQYSNQPPWGYTDPKQATTPDPYQPGLTGGMGSLGAQPTWGNPDTGGGGSSWWQDSRMQPGGPVGEGMQPAGEGLQSMSPAQSTPYPRQGSDSLNYGMSPAQSNFKSAWGGPTPSYGQSGGPGSLGSAPPPIYGSGLQQLLSQFANYKRTQPPGGATSAPPGDPTNPVQPVQPVQPVTQPLPNPPLPAPPPPPVNMPGMQQAFALAQGAGDSSGLTGLLGQGYSQDQINSSLQNEALNNTDAYNKAAMDAYRKSIGYKGPVQWW